MVKKYKSGIDNHISEQKSHHEQHINTTKHKQAREIERLKMLHEHYFVKDTKYSIGDEVFFKNDGKEVSIESLSIQS